MIPLTRVERRWAHDALVTIFPSGAHPAVRGADVIDGGASLEEVCQRVPVRVAFGLRAAVWIFALAPFFVLFRLHTLGGLDPALRERVVLALLSSRVYVVRQLALLLKAFGALMFIAAAGVREGIVQRDRLVHLGLAKEARHVA
jgi:hypothetical protein